MILSQFRLPAENYVRTFEKFQPLTSLIHHYPDVFWEDLGAQPGTVHLSVNENAEPSVTPSRRIPIVLREKFKGELDRFQKVGVWAKVDEPTAWVSSVGIATKRSGSLRICINPRPLNQAVKREAHHAADSRQPNARDNNNLYWGNFFIKDMVERRYFWPSTLPPTTGNVLDVSPVCWPPLQPHSEYTGGELKPPIWSFSIKRDLLEAKKICKLLTKVSARPADHTEPIRRLTRQETEFNWTEEQEKAPGEVKLLLWLPPHYLAITTQRPSLKSDTSKKDLWATPLQRGKPIAHGDREKRYARIKKEMLAIVFSLEN